MKNIFLLDEQSPRRITRTFVRYAVIDESYLVRINVSIAVSEGNA